MSQAVPDTAISHCVLIAVGSNASSVWGGAYVTVQEALKRVEIGLGAAVTRSKMYRTPAFPKGAGPDFVNGAVAVDTELSADVILGLLHEVEAAAGRTRELRWGQRVLDLDLIACGDQVLPDRDGYEHWRLLEPEMQASIAPDQLILPHPRMQDRAFVLQPLSDVAPAWVHPVLGQTVAQMLAQCPSQDRASVVPLEQVP